MSELAREAGVAFSGAYRELMGMVEGGVAVTETGSGKKRYRANSSHTLAPALRQLLRGSRDPTPQPTAPPVLAESTRRKLAYLGAPLLAQKQELDPNESLEAVLLLACRTAHSDASVARVLPLVLARLNERLDMNLLRREAAASGEKHTVGFLLEVAGQLGHHPALVQEAARFFDRRRTRARPFFPGESKYSRALAEKRTPAVARRWGWRMNMGLDSFASVFDKFRSATSHA